MFPELWYTRTPQMTVMMCSGPFGGAQGHSFGLDAGNCQGACSTTATLHPTARLGPSSSLIHHDFRAKSPHRNPGAHLHGTAMPLFVRLHERAGSTIPWENRSSCCSAVPRQGRRFTCVACFYRAPCHGRWFSEPFGQVELRAGPERAALHSPQRRCRACVFSGLGG